MRVHAAIAVMSLALVGCAQRPAVARATAVGVGAFGTAIAASATRCNDDSRDQCRDVAVATLIAAAGVALSAASVAYLGETEDPK